MDGSSLALLPLWYAAFLLSITCHEAAHAWVARRGGDDTAHAAGQVTLNPLPHVRREVFGTVIVPILSYLQFGGMIGWASAPYDPEWEERHPRRAAAMALAGPLANLVLVGLAFGALAAGLATGTFAPPEILATDHLVAAAEGAPELAEGLGRFLSVMLYLNLLLFLFNLVPVPPLDGGAVAAGLIPPFRGIYRLLRGSFLGAVGAMLLGTLVLRTVLLPVLVVVLRLLYP